MAKKEKTAAAEKIEKAEKSKKKPGKPKRSFKKTMVKAGKAIKNYFKDFRGEIKKIVWPDAKTVLKNTGIVLAVVAIVGTVIYLIDLGLGEGINQLVKLAEKVSPSAEDSKTAAMTVSMLKGLIG